MRQLKGTLRPSFYPTEQVHFYQAEFKSLKRRWGESMAELGRDVVDMASRVTLFIKAFLGALPGLAIVTLLHDIKGETSQAQGGRGICH